MRHGKNIQPLSAKQGSLNPIARPAEIVPLPTQPNADLVSIDNVASVLKQKLSAQPPLSVGAPEAAHPASVQDADGKPGASTASSSPHSASDIYIDDEGIVHTADEPDDAAK